MKSARIYDFTIPANGSFTLLAEGDYLRIMSSTDTVEIVTDNYRIGPIKSGQGQSDAPFKRITINDKSGNANIGTLLVAGSGFVDQRISGEVTVIDGSKLRTLANLAFTGYGSVPAAGAGVISHIQLWNPTANKNLIVETISMGSAVSNAFYLRGASVAFGTLIGNAPSKMIAGAASLSEIRNTANAVIQGSAIAMHIVTTSASQLGQSQIYSPKEPIVIGPGKGLIIQSGLANADIFAVFEFYEDAV